MRGQREGPVANPIGRWRRRALETRRSPYRPEGFICRACSDLSAGALVYVKKCRVLQDGLLRPGVQCPRCLTTWVEAEEQPETVQ